MNPAKSEIQLACELVKGLDGIPIEAAQRASFSEVSLECPRSG